MAGVKVPMKKPTKKPGPAGKSAPAKKAAVSAAPKSSASPARKKTAVSSQPSSPAAAKAAPRLQFDAIKVAKEVLRLSESGQHEAILRVLGDEIGPDTGAVAARKAFLRISMLIHPDKLRGVPEATKAFQGLVAAFDFTQMGGVRADSRAPQHATISRSNEGCFKHDILCPRCEGPWGKKVEGNPDYFYNFMMESLRCFTCSTCLLKFGCLTGIHLCPFCRGTFEYYPDQYHQKITCGNACCNKRFGFVMFHASERALSQAREQVRAEFEAESRHREQKAARLARLARRLGNYDRDAHEEKCFTYGLRDTCPRCGLDLSGDDEAQVRHLRTCTDANAQRAHQEREARKTAAKVTEEKKALAQHNSAGSAVFNFCGGSAAQLWLLNAEQLKKLCSKEQLPSNGSRNDLIERLAEHYGHDKRKGALTDIPKNLHSLSEAQLSGVCAAHSIKGLSTREERIEALEELAAGTFSKNTPKAIAGQSKSPALADKKYLRQQGNRVVSSQAKASAKATSKLTPQRKRRRVED